jgi:MFS family permease
MQGALITPALTRIAFNFSGVEDIEFLAKLIIAVPPIFIALFSPLSGLLFEKFGRKKILIFSAILYGLAGSSGYFANDINLILIGRAMLGIAISGLMTGFIVIIGDLFSDKIRMNRFIGLQGALMSFAGVFYLLAGEFLANISWNLPFTGYLFSIIIAIGLLFFLKETKNIYIKPSDLIVASDYKSTDFIKIHLLAVGIMICYLMIPTQIPFILKEFPELNNKNSGIFLALWILFSSISSILYSKIRKYLDYSKSYSLSFLLWGIGFFLIFAAPNYYVIIISLIFSGIGNGIAIPNIKAQLLDYADEKQRAKQSGLLSMSLYIGQFLSPIIVEPIIRLSSIKIPFLAFSIILIIFSAINLLEQNQNNQE